MMKSLEFVEKAKNIANNYKTLYIMGCFGSPMNDTNKKRYTNNSSYNKRSERTSKINAASYDTFGFDCVCLIKGILWGWDGNVNKTYGGATYKTNGVVDVGANAMMNDGYCKEVSTDFSNIKVGELVWMEGHIGIYIGDGLAVECTPIWSDGVQITAVKNLGAKSGYNNRTWTKHGKSIYVDYSDQASNNTSNNVPVFMKFKKGDKVVLNGYLYKDSYGNGKGAKKINYKGNITITNKLGTKPYHIDSLGWVAEADLKISNSVTYMVVKGDTLSKIANKYNTTVDKLVKDNNIKNKDLIYVGQKIVINS